MEKELEDKNEDKENVKEETLTRVTTNKNSINEEGGGGGGSKLLLKNLLKNVESVPIDSLDEEARALKADQEKCKGNEAFNAGSYEEALAYYTRSIQYLPNAASYNNRALACKLKKYIKSKFSRNHLFLKFSTANRA